MSNESVELESMLSMSETELLTIIQTREGIRVRRGLPRKELIDIARGDTYPIPETALAETRHTRKLLEKFLAKHWEQVRSQLPGCDGKCTTFPCSEGRHALCFGPNKDTVAVK